MGLTTVEVEVKGPTGASEHVRFLIDSGATYSLIPKNVWEKLKLNALGEARVELADGRNLIRPISECRMDPRLGT